MDKNKLREHVNVLCAFDRSSILGQYACREYIKDQLQGITGKLTEQEYKYKNVSYYNVVVTFGKDKDKTILMAHYDAVKGSPGADDNASSCAFLIEFSKILTSQNVEIIFTVNEEPPIFGSTKMGSYIYANSINSKNIKYLINFEMLGYYTKKEKYLDIGVYNDDCMVVKAGHQLQVGFKVKNITYERSYRDMSDHLWFFGKGIRTMIISDTGGLRNENMHTTQDIPDTLDYDTMALLCSQISDFLLDAVI